jgi:inhibitor of KinA sporulation pathway (predicted exonuclease)
MEQPAFQYLILDFEANCSAKDANDHEVLEFPAVLLDSKGHSVAEFRCLVLPVNLANVSTFVRDLTGIKDAVLRKKGVSWTRALLLFDEWCDEHNVDAITTRVVTCGDWDLQVLLPRQLELTGSSLSDGCKKLFERWTNLKTVYEASYNKKARGMASMLNDLGIVLEGRHHSGIDDCRNIARICEQMIHDGFDIIN